MVWPLPGAFELSVPELSVFESIGFKSRIFRCLGECNEPLLECQRDQNREFLSFLHVDQALRNTTLQGLVADAVLIAA